MNRWANRRNAGITLLSLLILVAMAPGAGGQEEDFIVVPIDTIVRGPEGSTHLLASVEVPEPLQGQDCLIAARADNQGSVHPDNDLVVESDGSSIVLPDVEREPGVVTVAEGELLLGSTLSVSLIMGPDGVFSAGVHVGICAVPPPPTSTTTTTIQPSTTLAPTTTTTTTTPPTTAPPTTPPEATSTTVGPESTTTTVVVASSTTVAETTTTTGVAAESTTTSTLPFTGLDTDTTAGVGLVALALGMALLTLTRSSGPRGRHSNADS